MGKKKQVNKEKINLEYIKSYLCNNTEYVISKENIKNKEDNNKLELSLNMDYIL